MRYSAAWCRSMCYLYLWKHSHIDCGPTISHNALWCPVCPVWANLLVWPRGWDKERATLSLYFSLLNTISFSLALFHIFFCKSITPSRCCLQFLLVRVWLSLPGRDYHSWDCPLCSRAPIFHSLASLPLSAFRGRLFPTRKSRESPPCACL